jgi:HpiC1 cyclase/PEP-CTERM motif
MMLKKLAIVLAFVLCITVLSGTAWADNIPIVNPSFETPAGPFSNHCGTGCSYSVGSFTGWTTLNGGEWQPGTYFSSIPDGSQIGYTNATRSLTQDLTGQSVAPNSLYTFSFYVGNRNDGQSGFYTISLDTLLGGATSTLCSFSGNASGLPGTPGSVPVGTFLLESCNYTSGGSGFPGGDLFLVFTANTGQLDVDNVSLTVQGVPEPSSVLLLGVGMLFLVATLMVRRKKELQFAA